MLSTSVIVGLIAMLTWGIADFLQSIPVRKIGIYKTMFLSNFFGYILLLPIFFFRQYLSISFSNLVLLFIGGFFQAIAVKNFYEAMQTGEIAIVTPISASYPLVSVILFILFLGSKLNFITGIAIFILILGIVLTSTDIKKLKNIREAKGVNQAIIAFFIWGVEFFVLDLVAKEHILFGISFPETSYIAVFFFSSLFNGLFMLVYSLMNKGLPTKLEIKDIKKPILIILITAITYAFTWIVVNYGLAIGNSAVVTSISSIYPLICVILAMIFYKEKLVLNQKIGIVTIVIGLVLISF